MRQDVTSIWQSLNERQRVYLQTLYECDQGQESFRKSSAARGYIFDRTPASEWRWVLYGPSMDSLLYTKLCDAKLVDKGTGSTWEALEVRGLVQTGYIRGALGIRLLRLKITSLGRKVIRVITNELPKPKKLKGQLTERQWAALVVLYKAGQKGLSSTEMDSYRFDWWWTLRRLEDYKPYQLMESYNSRTEYKSFHRITSDGINHYYDWWERYQELYPDIDAPDPNKISA